jgi:hypothetical protein
MLSAHRKLCKKRLQPASSAETAAIRGCGKYQREIIIKRLVKNSYKSHFNLEKK